MTDSRRDAMRTGDDRIDGSGPGPGILVPLALLLILAASRSHGQDAPPTPGGSVADLFRTRPDPSKDFSQDHFPPPPEKILSPTEQAYFATPQFRPDLESKANDALARARQAFHSGNWWKAIEESSAAIRLFPEMGDAYRLRSEVYASRDLNWRAIADLNAALRCKEGGSNRLDPSGYLQAGYYYCKERHFDLGIGLIERGLALCQDDTSRAIAYSCRGAALALRGDHALAVADFDRAIDLAPGRARNHFLRGRSLLDLGMYDRAIADYFRGIVDEPKASIWFDRGDCHFRREAFADAQADYERAIEADPENRRYQVAHGLARLARGDVSGAIGEFDRVLQADPKSGRALTGRGWAYLAKHDLGRAIADFEKAIEIQNPRLIISAYAGYGTSFYWEPKNDHAIAEFDERCRQVPDLPWALIFHRGVEGRSGTLQDPYFALYLVCRPRADSGVAPNFIVRIYANWQSTPEATSACAGRIIAACLQRDWVEARDGLWSVLNAWSEARFPGSTRPTVSELLDIF